MNKTIPEIRFKGFTDDWEQRKLGEIVRISSGFTGDSSLNIGQYELTRIETIATGQVNLNKVGYSNTEPDKKYLLDKGDILFSNINSLSHIGKIALFDLDMKLYHGINLLRLQPMNVNSQFLYQSFQLNNHLEWAKSHANQAVSQASINQTELSKQVFLVPSQQEQQKIGTFFKQLDDTIALHQRQLENYQKLKKAILQKLFPEKGAEIPKIRFDNFTEKWEQRKLSNMTQYKNGKGHEDRQVESGKLELVNLNSISIDGGLKYSGKFVDEADETLMKDDLVMILSDVGHGDLLGRVALIPEDNRFVLNQRVALLRTNETANPKFLFSYINAHQYYFKSQGAGMSQLNISKGSVENFTGFVPSLSEQKQIGNFFKQLDDTIALQQKKVEELKKAKKYFLKKMFI